MSNSATYLLRSRVLALPGRKLQAAGRLSSRDRDGERSHAAFAAFDGDEIMELTAFRNLDELPAVMAERAEAERGLTSWLAGEWRHDILGYVEDVIPGHGGITKSPMVEMRHIEVNPALYSEYRTWREQTIYLSVRGREEIDDFRSYHSVLSTNPGVMFIVGFSSEPERYREVYKTSEYLNILKEAGSRYIVQGLDGLECKIYGRPHVFKTGQAEAA
jgi:hypothetical protein